MTICQQIGKTTKYAYISEQLQSANTGKNDNMTETTIREITTKCPYRAKTTSANTGKITTIRQHRQHYYNIGDTTTIRNISDQRQHANI